ncbi:MAG: hypothetical protein HKN33_17480 [Pyrinomonadaceae bacterium]|nr:hypothetical protein [Pyrinomonadaceae bacterium]
MAIQSLLEPIETKLSNLEASAVEHFNTASENFDALFKSNELLRHEMAVGTSQMNRLEDRVSIIEKKS